MFSLIWSIVVLVAECVINFFIIIFNLVARLLGTGAEIASFHIGNSRQKKKIQNANDKVNEVLSKLYECSDIQQTENNVVVIGKKVESLIENSNAYTLLKGDENALAIAQDVQINYIFVQFQNNQRKRLIVEDSGEFDTVLQNDVGTLTYNGNVWVDFKRNA